MANDDMRAFWAEGAQPWVEHRAIYDAELSGFADAISAAAGFGPGQRVLDLGCGTGTLVEQAVDRGARGVGVDISPAMVEAARSRVPGARFEVADAQTADLAALGPFDLAVSRFGVMFFDDPVAAFANIRGAMRPSAPLVFACWRTREENQMFLLGTSVLVDRLDPAPEPAPPGAPGPVAFADPDRVRSILMEAGWKGVTIDALDVPCDYGIDGSDGVEERMVMVLGNSTGRLAAQQLRGQLGVDGWEALLEETREEIRRHLVDGRVLFNGAGWLVRATA